MKNKTPLAFQVIGNEGLLMNKTRILVTHGLQWLPMVDHILVMKEGRVTEAGSYEDLVSREDSSFAQWLSEELKSEMEKEKEREKKEYEAALPAVVSTSVGNENGASCERPRRSITSPSSSLSLQLWPPASAARRPPNAWLASCRVRAPSSAPPRKRPPPARAAASAGRRAHRQRTNRSMRRRRRRWRRALCRGGPI